MSDNPDKQDDLQRMLALKRNETPPPRFFKGFSREVIERIHDPEPAKPLTARERFQEFFSNRPVQVGLFSLVVLGCLAAGIIASRDVEPPKPQPSATANPKLQNATSEALPSLDQPAVVSDGVAIRDRHPDISTVSNNTTSAPQNQIRR